MEMNKRSKFIFLILMILFFGMILAPAANAASEKSASDKEVNEQKSGDDSQCSEWIKDHTLEVEVTTIYDYKKDGSLKITEIYSGEKLKSKYKEDKLTRSQVLSIPDGEEISVSTESGSKKLKPGDHIEVVTQESMVLTPEDEPPYPCCTYTSLAASSTVSSTSEGYPQWTFSKVTSLFKTYYKMEDPINLVWEQNNLKTVKDKILNQKWVDNPVEYTHYILYPDGKWVAGDGMADSKYRLSGGYHLRLWVLPCGAIVSNAHHDDNVLIIPGHQVDGYENAEDKVAGFFGNTYGSICLENEYYSSYYNAYNDGSAALV